MCDKRVGKYLSLSANAAKRKTVCKYGSLPHKLGNST